MKCRYMLAGMLLTLIAPSLGTAATDCRIVDLNDHVELVCVGDEAYSRRPVLEQKKGVSPVSATPQAASSVPGKAAKPTVAEVINTAAVQNFQKYIQHDRERLANVISKREYRLRTIQAEMRLNPPPVAQEEPQGMDAGLNPITPFGFNE